MNKLSDLGIPLDKNCQLIEHHHSGIFAFEKAPGVLSHPNHKHLKKSRSLLHAEYCKDNECYEWQSVNGERKRLYLCHRLDSPTSGIIIGSSDSKIAENLKKKFENREVEKTYLAITPHNPKIKEGIWRDRLIEKRNDGNLRVVRGNGPECLVKVKVLRKNCSRHNLQLIEMKPLTGRTHQLRVQSMLRRVPILGDKTYGDFSLNRRVQKATKLDRLCLHSTEISFTFLFEGKETLFKCECPLPRLMGKILT
jgi:23S rRNA pseudouridine955/2504/2580 synthase